MFADAIDRNDVGALIDKWMVEDIGDFFRTLRRYLPSDLAEIIETQIDLKGSVREIFRLMTGGLPTPDRPAGKVDDGR